MNKNIPFIREDLSSEDLIRLQKSTVIAVDTETTGLNPNRDILSLIQIYDKFGDVILIKSKNWRESVILQELFRDSKVQKIFHFALFDCSFILKNLNVDVTNPYCTKIASKIARTYSPNHSLKDLVQEFIGIELNKKSQSTDWLKNDLSAEQIEYAANDVRWLLDIKETLEKIMEKKGILPTGISYIELNRRCQEFIPTLVHLWINGWDIGSDNRESIFAH